ncbi:MAG: carotenoid oxygenase family protein [Paraglaciecola sp.]|uniref:carotenoid oxygenase family protein n=1 Tax=Paraglaciecola sp. TaxID=1920173 RepID=UPI00329874EF
MERRTFIKQLALLGAASAVPFSLSTLAKSSSALVNVKDTFNQTLATHPELIGFANVESDYENTELRIEGALPKDLQGQFVRNGPAKHERANERYQHWFEGDGMLHKFTIEDNKIKHTGKFIRTPKFIEEEQAQRFLYSGPDSTLINAKEVSSPNVINVANTNVIPVNDELWALWEGGSATAINLANLDFKHQVNLGSGTSMASQLQGMPFSAHPKVEANGDIWNFGLAHSGDVVLYHLGKNGKLKNIKVVKTGFKGAMLHDFLITQNHILLILPSLDRKANESRYFEGVNFNSQLPMRVMVITKSSLSIVKRYELRPGFAFHFGNAWEDKQGLIRFDASYHKNVDVLYELSDLMQGKLESVNNKANTTVFSLYPNGQVEQHAFDNVSEFPRVCQHLTGLKTERLFHVTGDHDAFWNHAILGRELTSGKADKFDYGPEFLVEEHIPVCPTLSENHGYLIGTALHVPSKRTCLNVFDMNAISQGPLARAWLSYHIPLGFHGNFVNV